MRSTEYSVTRSYRNLGQILVEQGKLSSQQLEVALETQKTDQLPLGRLLIGLGYLTEEQVIGALYEQLPSKMRAFISMERSDHPLVPDMEIDPQLIQLFPMKELVETCSMPLSYNAKHKVVSVAMVDTKNHRALRQIGACVNCEVLPVEANISDIHALWKTHLNIESPPYRSVIPEYRQRKISTRIPNIITQDGVVSSIDIILSEAVRIRASDIHLDHFANSVAVRFRIDGVLFPVAKIAADIYPKVVTRIKVLASLDVTEKRRIQESRISIADHAGQKRDFRVSILPVYKGERIAIRVLDRSSDIYNLDSLGIQAEEISRIRLELEKSQGLVLVTGPTGSGKTTTLYSMIGHLNDLSRNIISIEDPVECIHAGVGQVQIDVRSGIDFASALKSVLRQDPNVIMVGEIRDEETAQLCIRAAQTGHKVLATVHTNDAVSVVSRLRNLGVKGHLIGSCLGISIAQRLLRKICPKCRVEDRVDYTLLLRLGVSPQDAAKYKLYRGAGCVECNSTGYQGRLGLFEIVYNTSKLRDLVEVDATQEDLRKQAIREGMRSLVSQGLEMAAQGKTTLEEVIRNTAFEL